MMPIRNPSTGSRASGLKPKMVIRMGSEIAMANGPPSPGVAPTTMPPRKPRTTMTTVIEIGRPKTAATGASVNTAATPSQT